MESSAQNNEDLVLMEFFGDHQGVFIDVGAHDGIQFSNTYLLEQNGWHGLCIEPNPVSFIALKKNRSAMCAEIACHDMPDETWGELLIPNGFPVLGVLRRGWSPKEVARILRIPISDVNRKVVKVLCAPLDVVITDHLGTRHQIDLVSIDTEGTELQVLAGMDVERFKPRVLVVEGNSAKAGHDIGVYLKAFDYELAGRVAVNYFFARRGVGDVPRLREIVGRYRA